MRMVHELIFCPQIGPFHIRLAKDFHFVAVLNMILNLLIQCGNDGIPYSHFKLTKVDIMKSLFCSIETPIWDTFYTPRGFVKSSLIRCSDLNRDSRSELPVNIRLDIGPMMVCGSLNFISARAHMLWC